MGVGVRVRVGVGGVCLWVWVDVCVGVGVRVCGCGQSVCEDQEGTMRRRPREGASGVLAGYNPSHHRSDQLNSTTDKIHLILCDTSLSNWSLTVMASCSTAWHCYTTSLGDRKRNRPSYLSNFADR